MMKIVCVGDSNTWGYDPRSFLEDRYPENVRWTGLLQLELNREAGGQQWKIINEGMNGRQIPLGKSAEVMAEYLLSLEADLYLIMLGANDLLNGYAAGGAQELGKDPVCQSVVDRLETFGDLLEGRGLRLMLIAPPAMKEGSWVMDQGLVDLSREYSKAVVQLAERRGWELADLSDLDVAMCYDGVHFTEEGHRLVGTVLAKLLKKYKQNQDARTVPQGGNYD